MKKLKISKNMKDNIITYGMVVAAFIIVEILVATGNMSVLCRDYWFLCAFMSYWQFPLT